MDHLKRSGRGDPMQAAADCTVKRVLEAICKHQGEFLKGAPKRDAVEKVVGALVHVAAEGASAQTGQAEAGLAPPGVCSSVASSAGGCQSMGDPPPRGSARPLAPVTPPSRPTILNGSGSC